MSDCDSKLVALCAQRNRRSVLKVRKRAKSAVTFRSRNVSAGNERLEDGVSKPSQSLRLKKL